jgi:hypothetical protein
MRTTDEGRFSHPTSAYDLLAPARSVEGHLYPYAASSPIGGRAPIPDLPGLTPERGGSTLQRPSWPG